MLKAEILTKLQERQEQLANLFIEESDRETWPSLDTPKGRGDRYWIKKNCAQTLGIIVRLQSLFQQHMQRPAATDPEKPDVGDPEDDLAKAEKAALREAERVIARAGKSNVVKLRSGDA